MLDPLDLVTRVLDGRHPQELHWLEWKSDINLGDRLWLARVARFILGAGNRPPQLAKTAHGGSAYIVLGVEPGHLVGTEVVDPAKVGQGLTRFLGTSGPPYTLEYVALEGASVAVLTVHPVPAGSRPYLARNTYSGDRVVLQDGRIYVRHAGSTDEATADEVEAMIKKQVKVVTGFEGRREPVLAWRDGDQVVVQVHRDDQVRIVTDGGLETALADVSRRRPALPAHLPQPISEHIAAAFEPLKILSGTSPSKAIEDAWDPLRQIAFETYRATLRTDPPIKVIDMVAGLAAADLLDKGWMEVAYVTYYWPIDRPDDLAQAGTGTAMTYVSTVAALATAMLLAKTEDTT